VLDNNSGGAAFFIPHLKVKKSFSIGKHKSIFTAELLAIVMALQFLVDFPHTISQVLFCVDSKSALYSLKFINLKVRPDLVIEIVQLIHFLSLRGCNITFCWIPSHCNFYFNSIVDVAAKQGAMGGDASSFLHIPMSVNEWFSVVDKQYKTCNNIFPNFDIHILSRSFKQYCSNIFQHRQIVSLLCRWKSNSFKTKFVENVKCLCHHALTPDHLISCLILRAHIPILDTSSVDDIFSSPLLLCQFFISLLSSPVGFYV